MLMQGELSEARLQLFPLTTAVQTGANGNESLTIAGCDLAELADLYGTPLYLYDQATLDAAVEEYSVALERCFPADSGITYAGKAFLCMAIAQWATHRGLWLDCTGAGELHIAAAAGVPRAQILVHGVNKSDLDLRAAVQQAGTVVVDNTRELQRLAALGEKQPGLFPDLWLRLRPGLAVDTHAYRQTGQDDSKFGMSYTEAVDAVALCGKHGLPLKGIHFHQGSHFHDPKPIGPALERILDLISLLHRESGWIPAHLCPGGGWGIPYHEEDLPHPPIAAYVQFVAEQLVHGCQQRHLPLPALHLEPGRSLVARAGVALYRVGTVKRTPNRRWLLLDGGMADNIRPALYGARYSALPVTKPKRNVAEASWLAGPYCESGDVLIEDLPMPDIEAGELVAVPAGGAYHLMMSSNYNGALKPAVLWLKQGNAQLIQRRESPEDVVRRDMTLQDGIFS